MSVDVATGLPELPEGLFWRVGLERVAIVERVPAGEWLERENSAYLYLPSTQCLPGVDWRGIEHRPFTKEREVVIRHTWWSRKPIKQVRKVYMCRERKAPSTRVAYDVELDGLVSAETLLDICFRVKSEWEQLESARQLVGDYPPKTLEVA